MSSTNTAWKSHSLACKEINTPSTHSLLVMVPNYQTVHVPIVQSSLHRNDARDVLSIHNYFSNIFPLLWLISISIVKLWSVYPCQFRVIAFLAGILTWKKKMLTMLKYLAVFGCDVKAYENSLLPRPTWVIVSHFLLPKWQWSFIRPPPLACICHDMCGGHVIWYDLIHYVMAKPTKLVLSSVSEGHSNQLVNSFSHPATMWDYSIRNKANHFASCNVNSNVKCSLVKFRRIHYKVLLVSIQHFDFLPHVSAVMCRWLCLCRGFECVCMAAYFCASIKAVKQALLQELHLNPAACWAHCTHCGATSGARWGLLGRTLNLGWVPVTQSVRPHTDFILRDSTLELNI